MNKNVKYGSSYKIKVDKITDIMEEYGLTHEAAGKLCGLGQTTLSGVIRRGRASEMVIGKIAKGLGVEMRNIAIFPRNKKTAEAATPAADENIVPTKNNNNVTTTEAVCQNEDRLYFYDGEWRTEKRIYELVTIDKLVELLNLPVIAITRVR